MYVDQYRHLSFESVTTNIYQSTARISFQINSQQSYNLQLWKRFCQCMPTSRKTVGCPVHRHITSYFFLIGWRGEGSRLISKKKLHLQNNTSQIFKNLIREWLVRITPLFSPKIYIKCLHPEKKAPPPPRYNVLGSVRSYLVFKDATS